jgi:hypothetical protein
MNNQNFTYSFQSSRSADAIFDLLLHIDQWWSGFYGETIEGKSQQVDDEFTFTAGGGMHYTRQKLTELVPNKHIAWEVTDAKLTFASDPAEWKGTTFSFDLAPAGDKTNVTFTHYGLVPVLDCYEQCSGGWTTYLDALKKKLS